MSFAANGTEVWKSIGRACLLLACHHATAATIINRKNVAASSQLARSHLPAGRDALRFSRLRASFGDPVQLAR